jgi:hypothetical protein
MRSVHGMGAQTVIQSFTITLAYDTQPVTTGLANRHHAAIAPQRPDRRVLPLGPSGPHTPSVRLLGYRHTGHIESSCGSFILEASADRCESSYDGGRR